jgi:hypothetical protein
MNIERTWPLAPEDAPGDPNECSFGYESATYNASNAFHAFKHYVAKKLGAIETDWVKAPELSLWDTRSVYICNWFTPVNQSAVVASDTGELKIIFKGLVEKWQGETGGHSVLSRRYAHPAYQAILGLGKDAIPLVLRELQARPDWWFEALNALAKPKVNPVKEGSSFADAVGAWLDWGRQHRILP